MMSKCGSSTLKDRVDVSSCLTHLVQPLEVVCGNPRLEPALDKPGVSRCAGMHERLGKGRGCMAAVRGQQSRGCGSERQMVPFLSWLSLGIPCGRENLSGKGLADHECLDQTCG